MDILSHGLWTGAAYKALNYKSRKQLNVKWAAFWGIFPDLFAFTLPFTVLIWNLLFGHLNFSQLPGPEHVEPGPPLALAGVFAKTARLYSVSHSLLIFTAVIILLFLIKGKIYWEMGGWLLHILIDVPTHSYKFYPTPLFWPFSDWKFNGFSWADPWFLGINYLMLAIVYLWLWRKTKTQSASTAPKN